MTSTNTLDIAICTYAPDRTALKRMCDAIKNFVMPAGWHITLTLIDNNSPDPVANFAEVQDLLAFFPNAQCLVAKKQGLAFARHLAISHTHAPWLLFFDDDNEPDKNYLCEVVSLIEAYPSVGIWGAGQIDVHFTEPMKDNYVQHYLGLLGQNNRQQLEYACIRSGWLSCYPSGMGMAIRRTILLGYFADSMAGNLTAVGRSGRGVLSGEDVQIVFEGVKRGFAAGSSPALKLNHLITPRKANFTYILKIAYGNGVSYAKAYYESFGYQIPGFYLPSTPAIIRAILQRFWTALLHRQYRSLLVKFASYLGQTEGNFLAANQPVPWPLQRLKALLKLA